MAVYTFWMKLFWGAELRKASISASFSSSAVSSGVGVGGGVDSAVSGGTAVLSGVGDGVAVGHGVTLGVGVGAGATLPQPTIQQAISAAAIAGGRSLDMLLFTNITSQSAF